MSAGQEDQGRQIIPRWHDFRTASALGEAGALFAQSSPILFTRASYKEKEIAWLNSGGLLYAIDFVGTALILQDYDNESGQKAARFIQEKKSETSSLAVEISHLFLLRSVEESPLMNNTHALERLEVHTKIAYLKQKVREYPINAIAWTDLSLLYSTIGQLSRAERCMRIASELAPENRFVLRSGARFHTQFEQPDEALYYLRRSQLSRQDPWLVASEISISEAFGQKSRLLKYGIRMLQRSKFSPHDLAELAGTVGTLEFYNGATKKAKKLLRFSLTDPNENTVAQTVWISPKIGFHVGLGSLDVLGLYEAHARMHFQNGRYRDALKLSWEWLHFQPFNADPGAHGSYVALVALRDEKEAIKIVEKARVSCPEDTVLINNHACALAVLNEPEKALEEFKQIDHRKLTGNERQAHKATGGLIMFRHGNSRQGQKLYKAATEGLEKGKDFYRASIAYAFWAREESLIGNTAESAALLEKAFSLAKSVGSDEILSHAEGAEWISQ